MKTVESPYSVEELLRALWYRKWLVLAMVVIGIIVGFSIFGQMKPKYEATSEILINTDKSENYMYTQNMMETYREMLTSTAIVRKVNDAGNFELTTNAYNEKVKVSMMSTSQLITITAKSTNEDEPVKLVNTIVDVFEKELKTYSKVNTINVLNKANESTLNGKKSFNQLLSVLFGAVIGLLLGIIVSLLLEVYRSKVNNEAKVQRLGVPLLAELSPQQTNEQWTYYPASLITNELNAGRKTIFILNDTPQSTYTQQLSQSLSTHLRVALLTKGQTTQLEPSTVKESEADIFTYTTTSIQWFVSNC